MMNLEALARQIKSWGMELGFQDVAISDVDLSAYKQHLDNWLANNFHGDMHYMTRNLEKRLHPELLHASTCRVITARMDYLFDATHPREILGQANKAYIARYALGRDYHKLIRKRLAKLAEKINAAISELPERNEMQAHHYRAFTDSAPILEKALAEKAGLGWIGKNTLLMTREAGSWFFLGEVFTNLPLPVSAPLPPPPRKKSASTNANSSHCGACQACIKICPTGAIVGANQLDARKCISYLTIENPGGIPEALRKDMGNRIFGCDDCQLICPWNRYAQYSTETDFRPRNDLDNADLLTLFLWSETEFLKNTEGSAIRRIKFWQWQRNIIIALGNAQYSIELVDALRARLSELQQQRCPLDDSTALLKEHLQWALAQHKHATLAAQATISPV